MGMFAGLDQFRLNLRGGFPDIFQADSDALISCRVSKWKPEVEHPFCPTLATGWVSNHRRVVGVGDIHGRAYFNGRIQGRMMSLPANIDNGRIETGGDEIEKGAVRKHERNRTHGHLVAINQGDYVAIKVVWKCERGYLQPKPFRSAEIGGCLKLIPNRIDGESVHLFVPNAPKLQNEFYPPFQTSTTFF